MVYTATETSNDADYGSFCFVTIRKDSYQHYPSQYISDMVVIFYKSVALWVADFLSIFFYFVKYCFVSQT